MKHTASQLPPPSESDEQISLFEWAAYHQKAYPEIALLYHIPNGGKRYAATKQLKEKCVRVFASKDEADGAKNTPP